MQIKHIKDRHQEAGFTLVELAIVMIIIGLLIGGILKGQELIANAQTTATIAQIKGIDGALSTFRDKYSTLPGDMRTPSTRLRDCTTAPCNRAGSGNGRIDTPALGSAPSNAQEGSVAFTHLAAADLITGVNLNDNTNPPAFGGMLPEAKVGGGFWMGYTATGAATGISGMRAGHYLVMNGLVLNAGGTNGGLTASQAAQIDRKMDDGDPESGSVQAVGSNCVQTNAYNEDTENSNCSLYIRIQG